mmetsp:Transcript_4454/g.17529  ORF Transcript_4454/g.17529 Transcript_4454/m.17529 type:complete len:302 (-) Transcript_4454:98-1003(-)
MAEQKAEGGEADALTSAARVILVRHGERVDEVDRSWTRQNPTRWFNPPLTRTGVEQAKQAGATVNSLLVASAAQQPFVVLASPLERALRTAVEVCRATGRPLALAPGLASCAAAARKAGGAARLRLASTEDVAQRFPELEVVEAPEAILAAEDDFYATMAAVVELGRDLGEPVVCVAHREAIRGLAEAKVPSPYACVADFVFESQWELQQVLTPDGSVLDISGAGERKRKPKTKRTRRSQSASLDGAGSNKAPASRRNSASEVRENGRGSGGSLQEDANDTVAKRRIMARVIDWAAKLGRK